MPGDLKRALREIKDFTDVADKRSRALEAIIKELTRQGAKAAAKVLSKYEDYLTPAERELLENVTDEQIKTLAELRGQMKKVMGTSGKEII
jgi:hypothetical protein